ncbi:MAG: glycoside hydrolase family 130 protein [Planctomycetota bacterium]|jgi:beta-1,4-mannooligosaccharide/beta-1,4-mannosyl-N-acetylglucosamine phosphorylase
MKRHPKNPILTRKDIPKIAPYLEDVTSVFNPGAVRKGDEYLLMLRVQNRGRETFLLMAESKDGVKFSVSDRPVELEGIEKVKEKVYHCYDPRITELEGSYYILFAMDMEGACRLGLARTNDFDNFQFMGIVSEEDNRNGVLFPEKVGGRYLRLDRPNETAFSTGTLSGDTICLSESDDLLKWRTVAPVMSGRFHYWDELIGAGPPPLKTREGWLQIYHGVALHLSSAHIYQAGVMLLDLKDPSKVIGRGRYNILEPREMYELIGQVPNVVFPSGAVAEKTDRDGLAAEDCNINVYYGAADTCVCLAQASVKDLIRAALQTGHD